MIHGAVPAIRRMAGGAVGTKLSVVFVLRRMAGITIGRRSFVDTVLMALSTGDVDVFTRQFEGGEVVVKLR